MEKYWFAGMAASQQSLVRSISVQVLQSPCFELRLLKLDWKTSCG